jgi:hypothetical protein
MMPTERAPSPPRSSIITVSLAKTGEATASAAANKKCDPELRIASTPGIMLCDQVFKMVG